MAKKLIKLNESSLRRMIAESVKRALSEEWDDMGKERRAAYNRLMSMDDEDEPRECDPEGTLCARHSFDFIVPGDEYYHKMVIKSTKDFHWEKLKDVVKAIFGPDAKLNGGMGNSSFRYNGYDLDKC